MNLEPNSVAICVVVGVILTVLILMAAAPLYADAIANGHGGEAGFWAWLRFSF